MFEFRSALPIADMGHDMYSGAFQSMLRDFQIEVVTGVLVVGAVVVTCGIFLGLLRWLSMVNNGTTKILPSKSFPLPSLGGFPRIWELLAFAIPKTARERFFEPAHEDLKEQFILARRYRTRLARLWIFLCFTFRTILMVAQCIGFGMRSSAANLLPHWLRDQWLAGPGAGPHNSRDHNGK